MRKDDRLHARTAHLVDGCRRHMRAQAGKDRRLPCRRLPDARAQHLSHDDLLDGGSARTFHGFANRRSAQLRRFHRREHALQAAHGRACISRDNDRIMAHRFSI